MAKIAPNLGRVQYEVKDVYKLMYKYCFPPDFKEMLRKRYESIGQGARCVQDFFANLELYRTQLSDITGLQHVRRAWDGAARHIRAEWAMKGYCADNATFDQLKAAALDIKRSYNVSRNQVNEHVKQDSHKGEQLRSPDCKQNRKDKQSQQNPQSNTHHQNKSSREQEHSSNWKKSKLPINSQQTGNSRSNLTNKQKERYRAEDQCYLCHKVGHMACNCTKANSAKPTRLRANAATLGTDSKVRASSVIVKEINQLYQTKDTLGISSVKVDDKPVRLNAAKTKSETVGFIERNTVQVKDNTQLVPQTIVVRAKLNGKTIQALLDSGSQADILSTTIVDQLHITRVTLTKPLQLQLAVLGLKSTVNYGASARLQYQGINKERDFNVGNLDGYDAILGTPWLYQHCVSRINGCNRRKNGRTTISVEKLMLRLVPTVCSKYTLTTVLPSKCAKKLRPLFDKKAREYLQTGRWELTTGSNAVPMLILTKKSSDGLVAIQTVLDKREQNNNTVKLALPLPPPKDVLLNVSQKKFRSVIDGKDAYKQIRVVPEDVPKTLFHTPLGTMVSMVMQQGDCNAGATYQSLMNHLFQLYIGVFMYVYLDDIVIFSDTIKEHVKHIRTVADILQRKKFYISPKKMQFFAQELILLGYVIDKKGIRMDPHKVDSIEKWKTPTTKDQVASYIGALGYLAPNCKGLKQPMAILSKCSSGKGLFRWDGTEERAFRKTQQIVRKH
ncbi:Transposon Ty3-G Gag-Pol polyprotein [Rhizoctonia solani]|uniref:Transposon Ty3-G Gag-Pol polyprotein n=1 Tax=Rhizoctonia solani TaxID=456999 RepID=A0A8H8P2M1_9AGAM|nr:Transposon Ty3-G Gag-Pol polyprotein [Rhizoctonia solani]QRW24379.1 Transposon Ty3-G Gag-Pol polyprotein [Rhizoctonia solani]